MNISLTYRDKSKLKARFGNIPFHINYKFYEIAIVLADTVANHHQSSLLREWGRLLVWCYESIVYFINILSQCSVHRYFVHQGLCSHINTFFSLTSSINVSSGWFCLTLPLVTITTMENLVHKWCEFATCALMNYLMKFIASDSG